MEQEILFLKAQVIAFNPSDSWIYFKQQGYLGFLHSADWASGFGRPSHRSDAHFMLTKC
jgi:hypothetical protein